LIGREKLPEFQAARALGRPISRRIGGRGSEKEREDAMSDSVFMADLTWVEYQRRIEEADAIVLLPVGAVEQHGWHLPLGCDFMLANEMCRRIALEVGGVVAPPVSYGYKSQIRTGGGNHYCGTTSLDGQNLSMMVRDVVKEFARHGAKKIAVIDGHYENEWFLTEGLHLATRELRADGVDDVKILKMRYCERIKQETLEEFFPNGFPGLDLEHAAVLETSLMLYLFPDLVHMDKLPDDVPAEFPPYDLYPPNPDWVPPSGALSVAEGSSAEIGRRLTEESVELCVSALRREFRAEGETTIRVASGA
jgi:creatinine amidohydrolase